MQTSALNLQSNDPDSYVLAPVQQSLAITNQIKKQSKNIHESKDDEDDIFSMLLMEGLGLHSKLHTGLIAGKIVWDEMVKVEEPQQPQPNLTTQAISPNVSWSSTSALQLQGNTDAQKQAVNTKKKRKMFFGGLKLY